MLKQITKIYPNLEQLYMCGINDSEYDREVSNNLDELKNFKKLKVLQIGDSTTNYDTVKEYLKIPTLEYLFWNGIAIPEKKEETYKIVELSVPFDIFPPNLRHFKPFITSPDFLIRGMNLLHLVLEKTAIPLESLKILVEELKVDLNLPIICVDGLDYYPMKTKKTVEQNSQKAKFFSKLNPFVPWFPYHKGKKSFSCLFHNFFFFLFLNRAY